MLNTFALQFRVDQHPEFSLQIPENLAECQGCGILQVPCGVYKLSSCSTEGSSGVLSAVLEGWSPNV